MGRPVIFSTHSLHPEVTAALQGLGTYRCASAPTPDAILAESAGAAMIVVRAPIPPALIRRETGLQALLRHGAGLDMIPVEVATEAGVLVTNVPGANALTVAEHVIWTSMALLRRFPQVNHDLRRGGWAAGRVHSDHGQELSGRRIGILGMGNIGREIARIAAAGFGMRVLCHTRSAASVPAGVAHLPLDTLLAKADILVLCAPLTDQTRGLIDAAALARLKRGAFLINVSRGPVVDEAALIAALRSGHLAGAALDVFDTQPLPPDHALLALPNVLITPHMAGLTEESMLRMGQAVAEDAARILAGQLPLRLINPEAADLYRSRFPA